MTRIVFHDDRDDHRDRRAAEFESHLRQGRTEQVLAMLEHIAHSSPDGGDASAVDAVPA